ncbi:MAG TPA: hypothetical protein VKU87_07420 [Thermomicrobiaceae bacterium]|nr:hypothetical protein [Thermomicrobiaceae bacterium]
MRGRAKIVLYLLGLVILAIAPTACGGGSGSSRKATTTATTGTPNAGQAASPASSPAETTPAITTQVATPVSTPAATAKATPANRATPPPVAAGTPSTLAPGNVVLNDSWFNSPSIGWLAGQGCVQVRPGTSSGQPPVMRCTGVIYHTVDGGKHWLSLDTGRLIPCKVQFTSDQTGWLIGVKNGDCFGSMQGIGVVQQTSDGGTSWTTRYLTSRPGILPADLRFTSNNEGWVTLSDCPSEESPCSWQVVSTADAGRNWSTSTIPITAHQASMSHPDASDGWVIAGGNGVVNIADSHDGGRTWQLRLIPTPLGGSSATIFFLNAQQGWFLTGGEPGAGNEMKQLYSTTDGGENWRIVVSGVLNLHPADGPLGLAGYVGPLVFTSPEHGWAFLPRAGVLQTKDGGKSWDAGSPLNDGAGSEEGLHFNGQMLGWSTFEGFVMLTSNGGTSWHGVPMPDSVSRNYGSPS